MGKQYVFAFEEGNKDQRNLLGGKGANLAEMTNIGLPVPQGFTITTEVCTRYYEENKTIGADIQEQIAKNLALLEEKTGKKLGGVENPLLVSVRSGAPISMPGMMDTVLNLGLNHETVETVSKLTGNERFAYDSFRRFIQMFSDVVLEISKSKFDAIFDAKKKEKGYEFDFELQPEDLKLIIEEYKKLVKEEKGFDFPLDPKDQLDMAIEAVFRSWNNERA
ncbi:MAG: pyruvate, phosphate dikinase, partial [Clostridiales bacterium]|nr:pyruvate, phosphate dikinase [Clostridiales bacterium]